MSSKPRLTQEQALKADLFGVQCPSVLTTEAERLLSGRISDLLDQLRDTTARAEQAEKRAPNWDHLSTISNFTEGCECDICTGETLLEAVEKHSLLLGKQQAEKDRLVLARLAHAVNLRDQRQEEHEATNIPSDGTAEALADAKEALSAAWRAASAALQRAKGGA